MEARLWSQAQEPIGDKRWEEAVDNAEGEDHDTQRQNHISCLDNVPHMLGPLVRRFLLGNKRISGWICDCPSLTLIHFSPSPLPTAWSKVPLSLA